MCGDVFGGIFKSTNRPKVVQTVRRLQPALAESQETNNSEEQVKPDQENMMIVLSNQQTNTINESPVTQPQPQVDDGVSTETTIVEPPNETDPQDIPVLVVPNETVVDPALDCNVKLLSAYGLTGIPRPHSAPLPHCPNITQSCCSVDDDTLSGELWEKSRTTVEYHYNSVISFYAFLFGFADKLYAVAHDTIGNSEPDCDISARDLVNLGLSESIATTIYSEIVKSIKFMADVRKGFYCSICEAKFHFDHYQYSAVDNSNFKNSIFFANSFCQKLVNETITASFLLTRVGKRYIEDFVLLANCKTGNSLRPKMNIDFAARVGVVNCYYFRNKFFFYYCQAYCQSFNLVNKNPLLDGNLNDLADIFRVISSSVSSMFEDPGHNFLLRSVENEKKFFETNSVLALESTAFFAADPAAGFDLSSFQTSFVLAEGIDPYTPTIDNTYEISILGVGVARWMGLLMIFMLKLII